MVASKALTIRQLLKKPGIIVAPGAWDAFSAKLIEYVGFNIVYASGGMISASLLGKPDIGLYTMSEMVNQVRYIVEATNLPVISDADNGYGNAMNVSRTTREFEKIGVAGIHIEDEDLPKKSPRLGGRRIIQIKEMIGKIQAAVDARHDENFILIARTNALGICGIEEALIRGHKYIEAGADMLFVESPENIDQLKTIGREFGTTPMLASMGGRITPYVTNSQLEAFGFKVVIYSGEVMRIAAKAIMDTLQVFRDVGDATVLQGKQLTFAEHFELLGIKEFYASEDRYLGQ